VPLTEILQQIFQNCLKLLRELQSTLSDSKLFQMFTCFPNLQVNYAFAITNHSLNYPENDIFTFRLISPYNQTVTFADCWGAVSGAFFLLRIL